MDRHPVKGKRVTSRSPPFRGCIALEGTSRDARVRVARAFFARGSARRVARPPARFSCHRAFGRTSRSPRSAAEGARSFSAPSRERPRQIRAGRCTRRCAPGFSPRTDARRARAARSAARAAEARAARRASRANPRAAAVATRRVVSAAREATAPAPGLGAGAPSRRARAASASGAARGERREQVLLERHRRGGGRRRGVGCE